MKTFKNIFIENLKEYFYVGGMPQVVDNFIQTIDYKKTRDLQQNILNMYENDFSKHADKNIVPRIRQVFNSISKQLSQENKKFKYGNIEKGARSSQYEEAILWLNDCGIVHKINRLSDIKIPTHAYEEENIFKLFFVDVGLLSCMNRLSQKTLIDGNELFVEFKGALSENFVCNELIRNKKASLSYYTNDRSTLEIDFILDDGYDIIPIEVKSSINLRSKSLKSFIERFNIKKAIRYSLADYKENEIITDVPMYAINN